MLKEGIILGDRYEIIGPIGSGGMAEVYKAKDHKLGRFVAVKVLKREFSEDNNFVQKFRVEAQSAARLMHPNIVNVYDVGNDEGVYYIVMELVEGITLKEYIQKKVRLSVNEAVSIAIQVAMGIEAAHKNHIIHRDIKPQNIVISRDGKVKVTDFGIARAASSETIVSNVMGSVHYTSPEQARGGYCDEKSDIYSFGITLYEMLTGKLPFDGETTVNVAIKHLQEEIEPPRRVAPDIPASLEKIILKCTQKSPDRRYANAGELIADLKKSVTEPDGDFVKMIPINNYGQTRMLTPKEVEDIKRETGKISLDQDERELQEEQAEEDEDVEINPKLEKLMTVLGIIAALIIASIALYLIGSAAGMFRHTSTDKNKTETETETETEEDGNLVEMPDIVGMTLDEATEILNDLGLGIKESYEYSDTFEKDTIMQQDIVEGDEVEKNTTVLVVVSEGPEGIEVPTVKGLEEDRAKNMLEDNGLVVKREYEYDDTVKTGCVISCTPAEGTNVQKGDTVTLIVSRGKEVIEVTVPDIRNLNETDARAKLSAVGLNVGTVSEANSESVTEGRVISQNVAGGTTVEKGTAVDFVLSLGPEDVPEVTYEFTIEVSDITFPIDVDSATIAVQFIQTTADGSKVTKERDFGTISKGSVTPASPLAFTVTGEPGVTKDNVEVRATLNGVRAEITYKVKVK